MFWLVASYVQVQWKGINQLFEILWRIATIGNVEINLFYGAWHTKSILLFFRNRRINAYCGDMWKWHIRSQSMWHSTDQSIHWPLPVRGEIEKWFKEYNIKSIMSVWAFSPFQGTWRIKLTVLCALWPFLWGNDNWYKCWPSNPVLRRQIVTLFPNYNYHSPLYSTTIGVWVGGADGTAN